MQLRRIWRGVLFAGLSLLPCTSAHAILTNMSRTPVILATSWSGVGTLRFSQVTDPNSSSYVPGSLTGTLIDSTHVLTAAHGVFDHQTGTAFDPSVVSFTVGSQRLTAASIAVPSRYNGNDKTFDLAIVTLTSPAIGVDTYAWNHGQINPRGKSFTMVGYGQTGSINGVKPSSGFGTKRAATNVVDLVTRGHKAITIQDQVARHVSKRNTVNLPAGMLVFDFDHVHDDAGPLGGGASSPSEGDGGNGDSGSPMFVRDANGQAVIIGLLLDGSDAKVRVGEVAWGANLLDQPYADFLSSNLGGVSNSTMRPNFVSAAAPVPEPSGALAVAVAAIGTLQARRRRGR